MAVQGDYFISLTLRMCSSQPPPCIKEVAITPAADYLMIMVAITQNYYQAHHDIFY